MLDKAKAKYIQSLGQKKYRDQEGLFIAEGPKIVAELLNYHIQFVKDIYAVKEWLNNNYDHLEKLPCTEITEADLEKISKLKTPHQVVAVVRKFESEENIGVKDRVSLVLDTIQDPGNLGAIIRTADWFGISQIICSEDCADMYNPKVVQATMGSIMRVKIFYRELEPWLREQKGIAIFATALDGRDLTKMNSILEGLILIGNESKGIRDSISKLATQKITVPRIGKAESLNAAVAAGIVLSHLTT